MVESEAEERVAFGSYEPPAVVALGEREIGVRWGGAGGSGGWSGGKEGRAPTWERNLRRFMGNTEGAGSGDPRTTLVRGQETRAQLGMNCRR